MADRPDSPRWKTYPRDLARRRGQAQTWVLAGLLFAALMAGAVVLGILQPRMLPPMNASLNSLATVLLLAGYVLIKRGQVLAHRRAMLGAFAVSVLFLTCYLVYHAQVGSVRFPHGGTLKLVYLAILISHILLAVPVAGLALWTIILGLRDDRPRHRRFARWTFPLWLYVSVTGVVIYLMLYHLPAP